MTWGQVRDVTIPLEMHGDIGLSSITFHKKVIDRLFLHHLVGRDTVFRLNCVMTYVDIGLTLGQVRGNSRIFGKRSEDA